MQERATFTLNTLLSCMDLVIMRHTRRTRQKTTSLPTFVGAGHGSTPPQCTMHFLLYAAKRDHAIAHSGSSMGMANNNTLGPQCLEPKNM